MVLRTISDLNIFTESTNQCQCRTARLIGYRSSLYRLLYNSSGSSIPSINLIPHADLFAKAILLVTSPLNRNVYDSLCHLVTEISQMSNSLSDVGRALRSMWCFNMLSLRLGPQVEQLDDSLGNILLDDRVLINPTTGQYYSVFLFEKMLICCTEHRGIDFVDLSHARYPIRPWEVGPALSEQCALAIVLSIPTINLQSLHCIDACKCSQTDFFASTRI